MIRMPAVAGSFYPDAKDELEALLSVCLPQASAGQTAGTGMAKGIILPHAGYVYSGQVAGHVLAEIEVPPLVLLLGPNHRGLGAQVAVSTASAWRTPLGDVPLAQDLCQALLDASAIIESDNLAHQYEHSLEVMLPLLLKRQPDLEIVPLLLNQVGLADCLRLGEEIATVLGSWSRPVLLLASSDMNHFASAAANQRLDELAIAAMTAYDAQRLYRTVVDNGISMCGVLAAVTVMHCTQKLGAHACRLVEYAHSGQVNGDNSRVVGYAGLVIE